MLTLFDRRGAETTALEPATFRTAATLQPFGLSPDPRFIYRGDSYVWAFEQITTAVHQREGLVLVTGEPGTGKTLLCRTLLARLSDRHIMSVVLDPYVTCEELLVQMLQDFGVLKGRPAVDRVRRHELIAILHRFLASLIPLDTTAVLVIDEAQHLDPAVLEQLRLLSNCESDRAKLLQIVLVGTPVLEDICRSPHLQHLDQRIARRCRLRPLRGEEVSDYIENRLGAAARATDQFSATAMNAIALASCGVPRMINLLCERSLDIAHRRGVSRVDASIVRSAASQLQIPMTRVRATRTRVAAAAGAVLLAGAASATWLLAPQRMQTHAPTSSSKAEPPLQQNAAVALASAPIVAAGRLAVPEEPTIGTLALSDGLTIQVAALREPDRAMTVIQQLRSAGLPAFARTDGTGMRRIVLVGPYVTATEVEAAQQALATQGFSHTQVIHEDAGALLP